MHEQMPPDSVINYLLIICDLGFGIRLLKMRLFSIGLIGAFFSSGALATDTEDVEYLEEAKWGKSAFRVIESLAQSSDKEAYRQVYNPILGYWAQQDLVDNCPNLLRSVYFDETRTGDLSLANTIKFKLKNFCVSEGKPIQVGCMPVREAAACLALFLDSQRATTPASISRVRLLGPYREIASIALQKAFVLEFIKQAHGRTIDPQSVYTLIERLPYSSDEFKQLLHAIPDSTAIGNNFFQIDPARIFSLIHVQKADREVSLQGLLNFVNQKQIYKSLASLQEIYSVFPPENRPLTVQNVGGQMPGGQFVVWDKRLPNNQ